MKEADVDALFYRLASADHEPTSELQYVNDYTMLDAVVLSAQATDIGVNKATRDLFETVRTPQAMLELGEEGLKQHIKTIGLFNAKARSEEHTSELQSLMRISYAVFCLKKKIQRH